MELGIELMTNMNTKSIKFRLLLWFCAISIFGLVVTSISFYLVTRSIIYQQVDRELNSHAEKLAEIVTRQGIDIHDALLRQQLYTEFSNIPGMVVILLDNEGNLIRSSLNTSDQIENISDLHSRVVSKGTIYENLPLGETPMRFIGKPIFMDEILAGVVLVAHPIDAIQKSITSLIGTLLIIFPLIIIPVLLVGSFLVVSILHPLIKISDQMSKITSERLDHRIDDSKTGDEIENLAHTFNDLLDRLQASFKRERQFIGDVAHELKTPVATLKSQIELSLAKTRTVAEYRQDFTESLSDINRLSNKIANILDLAWLGADNANIPENEVNLSNILLDLKEIAEKLAASKKVEIKSQISRDIFVRGSEDKLMRALLNVVDNAVKYTPTSGIIKISLKKRNHQSHIEVKDSGPGIPKADLAHVFERFYRGSKTSKIYGSGLGLAITKGIIQAHQGKIRIFSKPGRGTTISITFPTIS